MASRRSRRRLKKRKKKSKKLLWAFLAFLMTLLVMAGAGISVVYYLWTKDVPDLEKLQEKRRQELKKGKLVISRPSQILAADGTSLGYLDVEELQNPVKLKEIPLHLKEATISIEDRNFYEHSGVDYLAIVRASLANAKEGEVVQGASTLTQQLARNLYIPSANDTLERKIKEAHLAQELENKYSKDYILNFYLNLSPYGTLNGRSAIGVESASQLFFSKHVKNLNLSQSALLAGLPQSPSSYNPVYNLRLAKERQAQVLQAMAEEGYITAKEKRKAFKKPLRINPNNKYSKKKEPFFFDFVQDELVEDYGKAFVERGGLTVHTTLEPSLQLKARQSIENVLGEEDDPLSALVSIEPNSGEIKAMVSAGNKETENFDLTTKAQRQPGSTFKTFVLAAALRQGIDPYSEYYTSEPLDYDLEGYGEWNVETYDGSYPGTISVYQATLSSDNSVYAQLDLDVGPKNVTEVAEDLGIDSPLDSIPPEALGGLRVGVTPLEMTQAYSTLANNGTFIEAHAIEKIELNYQKKKINPKVKEYLALDSSAAQTITKILADNVTQGTGTASQIECSSAGKTGTTDNYTDAWFVGYTPKLATSVWVGYATPTPMTSVHGIAVAGGTFPAEIWQEYNSQSGAC